MDSFLIRGGSRLKGKIEISGSKNSALPILAACLMASGKTVLKGVPRLSDIDSMIKLLEELGCHLERHEPVDKSVGDGPNLNGRLEIEVRDEKPIEARYDIVKTMRASICVLGPLLAKRGRAVISIPGGAQSATGRSISTSRVCKNLVPNSRPKMETWSGMCAGGCAAAGCTWEGRKAPPCWAPSM